MKKTFVLFASAVSIFAVGINGVSASAKTHSASKNSEVVGKLSYKKVGSTATFNKNYSKFKLYNHVPNSNYKNIKSISWKKAGLNTKKAKKESVKLNMMASQGTRYNWYRFSVSKKVNHKTVSKNYWVYGQALNGKNIY